MVSQMIADLKGLFARAKVEYENSSAGAQTNREPIYERAETYLALPMNQEHANKRCIGLIPLPASKTCQKMYWSHQIDKYMFFRHLEVSEFTGGLRLCSEKNRFRASMLMLDGRVCGAAYSDLNSSTVLFNEPAVQRILFELRNPAIMISLYDLVPSMVACAASLFHNSMRAASKIPFSRLLPMVLATQETKRRTCMITVNGYDGNILAALAVNEGVLQHVFSFKHGWLPASKESLLRLTRDTKDAEICVSTLFRSPERGVDRFHLSASDSCRLVHAWSST